MEELLKHFIEETRGNFSLVRTDIVGVKKDLKDLSAFKVEVQTSTKWISILISSGIGLFSMAGGILINWYISNG